MKNSRKKMLIAAMAVALVTLGACQKEEEPIVATGGATVEDNEVYTTELPGTEWIMYDSMDWFHDGKWEKYPIATILQFKEDGVAYGYVVDYTYDPDDWTRCATYSYEFDGSEGEMTIVKIDGFGQSLVGSVFTIKYDGKQDALLYKGTADLPPLVYTRMK